jgi:chemotaxis protein MotB
MRAEQPSTLSGDDDSYLASVSDLMVGMLFVFIIMLMGFALSYRSAEEQAEQDRSQLMQDSAEVVAEREALMVQRDALGEVATELLQRDEARAALLTGLRQELQGRAVAVTVDPANGVLRLPESLLFDSGAATLRPEGEAALQAVAEALMQALPCVTEAPPALAERCPLGSAPLLEALLIEGHTDGQPIRGGAFADNWQLASARGVNTFKALTAARPDLELLRNVRGEALLGVSAYEARRPVAAGTSVEQRRLNRRIDLRFLVAAPAGDDLEQLRRRFDEASRP